MGGKEVELEGSPPVQGGFDGSVLVDSMVAKYTEERRVGDSAKLFTIPTTHGLMGSNIKETTVGGSRCFPPNVVDTFLISRCILNTQRRTA